MHVETCKIHVIPSILSILSQGRSYFWWSSVTATQLMREFKKKKKKKHQLNHILLLTSVNMPYKVQITNANRNNLLSTVDTVKEN